MWAGGCWHELLLRGRRGSFVAHASTGHDVQECDCRFKRQLPKYATRFIEMCVMLCADHGPAVSGARPASLTALRAGTEVAAPTACVEHCLHLSPYLSLQPSPQLWSPSM